MTSSEVSEGFLAIARDWVKVKIVKVTPMCLSCQDGSNDMQLGLPDFDLDLDLRSRSGMVTI